MNIINVADLKDPNDPQGRTYRQINAEKGYNIPIGTLVELETGERLFVVLHGKDCDGEPLYWLSRKDNELETNDLIRALKRFGGFTEASLKVVK